MTDIASVLEKLIDALQLEGHELFRIFAEVQGMKAIGDAAIVIGGILGLFIGAYLGNKWLNSTEKLDDDDIGFIVVIALVGLVIGLILSGVGVHVYMHINYPEYFAAKELLSRIALMMP